MDFFTPHKRAGLSWPELPANSIGPLWGLRLTLDRTQWLSAHEIVAGQLAQVRELVRHCLQEVPYYQDVYREAGIEPDSIGSLADFRRLPILSRGVFQQQFTRFQARNLPRGMVKTGVEHTSGTAGIPVEIWQTNQVNLWWYACFLRDLEWAGVDPRGTLASIRMVASERIPLEQARAGIMTPTWLALLEPLMPMGRLHALDVTVHPRRQLEWLERVQPIYLICSVAVASFLASLLQESGRRIASLRAVQVLSETLTEDAQQLIEAGFGVPVKDVYSCTEAGYLASPCTAGHGLHVHAENVLLEVLDDHDQSCAPGQTGRVVLTVLHNFITPLIRYDILDTATVGASPCPCGRGLPLLTRVHGKQHPIFRLPGDRYHPSRLLTTRLRKLGLCHQYQVVQRGLEHFVVRMVPNQQWNEASAQRIIACVQECLELPVRVEVVLQDRVELTARGKLRDVVIDFA
jgi:phenylacetate-CoA ligase